MITSPRICFPLLLLLLTCSVSTMAVAQTPIPVAQLKRDTPVSFEDEILPILQKNCLACHSASEAYGELVLETPAGMLTGGDTGPAIVPGKGAESLLLKVASHTEEPLMPPPENDVEAKTLTSQELGLLKLWIDQGARSTGIAGLFSPQQWQPLPAGSNPIYTVAVTPDGQFAACGRANQIFIYHQPTGRLITRLTDPDLQAKVADGRPGVAHLDIVQSLAFNAQGDRLASGGFRTAKIWHSPRDVKRFTLPPPAEAVTALAVSPDQQRIAIGNADHTIQLFNAADGTAGPVLTGHAESISAICFSHDGTRLYTAADDRTLLAWNLAEQAEVGRIVTPEPVMALTTVLEPIPPATEGTEAAADSPVAIDPPSPQERLVTASGNFLDVWQVPATLATPLTNALPAAATIATSPDGRYLALADAKGMVQVHDTQEQTIVSSWQASETDVKVMAFLPAVEPAPTERATDQAEEVGSPSDAFISPRLATAGSGGRVHVWDIVTGERLQTLHGSLTAITSLAARSDGMALATGNDLGQITEWKLNEPTSEPLPTGDSPAQVATLSPDGKLLATAEFSAGRPAIVVRDMEAGEVVATLLGHGAPVRALAFNAEGTLLVSGSADQSTRVWDYRQAKFPQLARFDGHASPVGAVAFNAAATQVLSGAADGSLKLWSVADGTELMDFPGHTASITGVSMLGGTQPVSASVDKTIRFWNAADGKASRSTTESAVVTALASSHDSKLIAAAVGPEVKLYQATDGKPLASLTGLTQSATTLDFNANDTRLLSLGGQQAAVHRTLDGRLLELISGEETLTAGAISNAGDSLLLCQESGMIQSSQLQFGQSLEGIEQAVTSLVYRNDNGALFAASLDGTVRAFNMTNGQPLFNANHGSPVHDLALSPDQQTLISAGDEKVKLWNATNGSAAQPAELTGIVGPVHSVSFAAQGTKIISAVAGQEPAVMVSTQADGTLEQVLRSAEPIGRVASIGRPAAAVSIRGLTSSGTISRWQLLHRQRIAGHTQAVTSLATVEGMQVVSGSLDGTVRHWDLSAASPQVRQMNHGGPVTDVAADRTAQRIASVSENSTAKLWNIAGGQQLAEMKGDLRAKELVAKATLQKTDWTAKVAAATTALEADQKLVPVKTEAEKVAATALAAAEKEAAAMQAELDKTVTAKVQAEKMAIEAAAKAQAAAAKMREANQQAMQLAAQVARMNEKATRTQTIAQANTTDQQLAKLADQAVAELAMLQEQAKEAEAAKEKPTQAAAAAAKVADDAAQVVSQMTKPYTDAATALANADDALRIATQAHDVAERDLTKATAAVPQAEKRLATAQEALARAQTELEQAIDAEQQAQQPMRTVAFSPDGRTVATAGDFGVVHTWSAEDGKQVSSYVGHEGPIDRLAYASAESIVSSSPSRQTIVWDANPAWELERTIGSIADPTLLIDRVVAVDFNQAGTLLATGGGVPSRSGEVKIWNVADGSLLHAMPEPHTDGVNAVAFSADDTQLASASADKLIKTWNVATGEQVLQLEGHTEHVLGVDWRANGQVLASAGGEGSVRIWNATNGDRIREINGYNKQVTDIRFVGQTQFAVAVSGDPLVRMHNTDNGGTQRNYAGAEDYMYAIDVTPDSSIVVAGGHAGVLRIWNGTNGQVLHSIEAPKEKTEEELGTEAASSE